MSAKDSQDKAKEGSGVVLAERFNKYREQYGKSTEDDVKAQFFSDHNQDSQIEMEKLKEEMMQLLQETDLFEDRLLIATHAIENVFNLMRGKRTVSMLEFKKLLAQQNLKLPKQFFAMQMDKSDKSR